MGAQHPSVPTSMATVSICVRLDIRMCICALSRTKGKGQVKREGQEEHKGTSEITYAQGVVEWLEG